MPILKKNYATFPILNQFVFPSLANKIALFLISSTLGTQFFFKKIPANVNIVCNYCFALYIFSNWCFYIFFFHFQATCICFPIGVSGLCLSDL